MSTSLAHVLVFGYLDWLTESTEKPMPECKKRDIADQTIQLVQDRLKDTPWTIGRGFLTADDLVSPETFDMVKMRENAHNAAVRFFLWSRAFLQSRHVLLAVAVLVEGSRDGTFGTSVMDVLNSVHGYCRGLGGIGCAFQSRLEEGFKEKCIQVARRDQFAADSSGFLSFVLRVHDTDIRVLRGLLLDNARAGAGRAGAVAATATAADTLLFWERVMVTELRLVVPKFCAMS